MQSDSCPALTASKIAGQFYNVASGERVDAYSSLDNLGNLLGVPVGSSLVT